MVVTNKVNNTIRISGGLCQGNTLNANTDTSFSKLTWLLNNKIIQTDNYATTSYQGTDTSGITVAGGNGNGNLQNQLAQVPEGVFVDKKGNVYVADNANNRIVKWLNGATKGITVAGGNGSGKAANQLNAPYAVAVDTMGNIYIADASNNRIQKWKEGSNSGVTVAGSAAGTSGATNSLLNNPKGIYLDASNNLYIADAFNHRIQKWALGATFATTVAGGNGNGVGPNQLSNPNAVFVDEKNSNTLYITDYGNYRVQVWNTGQSSGTTLFTAPKYSTLYGIVLSPDANTILLG